MRKPAYNSSKGRPQMGSSAPEHRRIRFGPFEYDSANRELRRDEQVVALQDQPLRMLGILLDHAGELVSRAQLREELWPNGTFVEFDHSLNTAVKKLRQALGDRPDQPQFIETVPRHGYRFIGGIEPVQITTPSASPARTRQRTLAITAGLVSVLLGAVVVLRQAGGNSAAAPGMLLNLKRLTADSGLTWQPAISRDGHLVAFSSDRADDGNLDLWVMQADGSDPVRLTNDPADDRDPDFCPDGRVVYRSDRQGGGVFIVPALGGTPVLLARSGRSPRCSPDGRWVAFAIGDDISQRAVYVAPTAGGEPVRIAPQLATSGFPQWSPDSTKLLVLSRPTDATPSYQYEWYLAPKTGQAPERVDVRASLTGLSFGPGAPVPAAWIAGTGEVLFSTSQGQRDYPTTYANLWSVSLDSNTERITGGVRQLSAGAGLQTFPSVADNGVIVFSNLELNPNIWAAPIDHAHALVTGKLERITREQYWESRPSVSADESTFVFRTDHGGGWDFWTLDLKTSHARPITISRETKVFPALSRDGNTVAWNSESGVYVADVRTGATRRLCSKCEPEPADWTKDGNIVAGLPGRSAIGILNPRDGSIREIIRPVATELAGAAVSPDDRWIAFLSKSDGISAPGEGNLMIASMLRLPSPGAEWIKVADHADMPRWSPDGRTLYFISRADGWACIWAVQIDDKTGQPLRPAAPVMHFHQRRYPLLGSYAVSSHRLFVSLHETTGNIWAGRRSAAGEGQVVSSK